MPQHPPHKNFISLSNGNSLEAPNQLATNGQRTEILTNELDLGGAENGGHPQEPSKRFRSQWRINDNASMAAAGAVQPLEESKTPSTGTTGTCSPQLNGEANMMQVDKMKKRGAERVSP